MAVYNIAIIGGTAIEIAGLHLQSKVVSTPYGEQKVYLDQDLQAIFIARHGEVGAKLAPHLINYRAEIAALRQLDVGRLIGLYAVGSISRRLEPGKAGLLSQFIDLTPHRDNTFCDRATTQVPHIALDEPYNRSLRALIQNEALAMQLDLKDDLTYVCTNGPRLETPAEIRVYQSWQADVVGMTAATETILANEAAIEMAGIAFSINWAAGVGNQETTFLDSSDRQHLAQQLLQLTDRVAQRFL